MTLIFNKLIVHVHAKFYQISAVVNESPCREGKNSTTILKTILPSLPWVNKKVILWKVELLLQVHRTSCSYSSGGSSDLQLHVLAAGSTAKSSHVCAASGPAKRHLNPPDGLSGAHLSAGLSWLGLSPAISSQFSVEMCAAAKNYEKFTQTPFLGDSRSLKVIDVDKSK